jgi:hypothetical protein
MADSYHLLRENSRGGNDFPAGQSLKKISKKRLIYHLGFIKLFETLPLSIKSVRNHLSVDPLKEALWPN